MVKKSRPVAYFDPFSGKFLAPTKIRSLGK